jgi:hypothetical protein
MHRIRVRFCQTGKRVGEWAWLTPAPSMVGFGSIICFTALRWWYDSLCPICRCSDTLSLHKLHLECDGDLLANQNAARFRGRIPGQAVIFAVDLRGSLALPHVARFGQEQRQTCEFLRY